MKIFQNIARKIWLYAPWIFFVCLLVPPGLVLLVRVGYVEFLDNMEIAFIIFITVTMLLLFGYVYTLWPGDRR